MSFVILTESQVVAPPATNGNKSPRTPSKSKRTINGAQAPPSDTKQSFSHQLDSTNRLFEILSARSDIDYPICTECTDLLLSSLQTRLSASTKERDAYISFLKDLNTQIPTPSDLSTAQASLKSTREAEARALSELEALEAEKAALDTELATLESSSRALDIEERDFWRSHNAFTSQLADEQSSRSALLAAYNHDVAHLETLSRTNIFNDTFCIGHDGLFGTINGLRLGRLAAPNTVDWMEINAAWGHAALLLVTVARKLQFTFKGFRIKPMGSATKIEKIELPPPSSSLTTTLQAPHPKATPLDLFSSGDLPLGRMLLHRRLDAGMVAFLECIRQLGEYVETTSSTSIPSNDTQAGPVSSPRGGKRAHGGLKLPYAIRKDKIGDVSIRLGASDDETWTKACKHVLTCCKFLLAHASNVEGGWGRKGG